MANICQNLGIRENFAKCWTLPSIINTSFSTDFCPNSSTVKLLCQYRYKNEDMLEVYPSTRWKEDYRIRKIKINITVFCAISIKFTMSIMFANSIMFFAHIVSCFRIVSCSQIVSQQSVRTKCVSPCNTTWKSFKSTHVLVVTPKYIQTENSL